MTKGLNFLKELLRKTCISLSIVFFILSLIANFLEINVFNSEYIVFYGLSVLGVLTSVFGRVMMSMNPERELTRFADNLGFFGNLAIVVLFFLPVYNIWGTLVFGP